MPLFKLASLALRSLSKPLASHVKSHLKENTTFTLAMTRIGNGYQRFISKISSEPKNISISRAVDIGSELVVEGSLFLVFATVAVYDHFNSKNKMQTIVDRIVVLENKIIE